MRAEKELRQKLISPEDLLDIIKPGNRIFLSSGPAMPSRSVGAIIGSENVNAQDLELIQLITLGDLLTRECCAEHHFRLKTFNIGESIVRELSEGHVDFIPANLIEIPLLLGSGAVGIDVAIVTASPPDANGYHEPGGRGRRLQHCRGKGAGRDRGDQSHDAGHLRRDPDPYQPGPPCHRERHTDTRAAVADVGSAAGKNRVAHRQPDRGRLHGRASRGQDVRRDRVPPQEQAGPGRLHQRDLGLGHRSCRIGRRSVQPEPVPRRADHHQLLLRHARDIRLRGPQSNHRVLSDPATGEPERYQPHTEPDQHHEREEDRHLRRVGHLPFRRQPAHRVREQVHIRHGRRHGEAGKDHHCAPLRGHGGEEQHRHIPRSMDRAGARHAGYRALRGHRVSVSPTSSENRYASGSCP